MDGFLLSRWGHAKLHHPSVIFLAHWVIAGTSINRVAALVDRQLYRNARGRQSGLFFWYFAFGRSSKEKYIDLSIFDNDYKNDKTGAPAYNPNILIK